MEIRILTAASLILAGTAVGMLLDVGLHPPGELSLEELDEHMIRGVLMGALGGALVAIGAVRWGPR